MAKCIRNLYNKEVVLSEKTETQSWYITYPGEAMASLWPNVDKNSGLLTSDPGPCVDTISF